MKKTLLIMTILMAVGTAAGQTANGTLEAIEDAQNDIAEMEEAGIPTERVETLLQTANNSYLAQKNFAEEGGTADYSRAMENAQRVGEIQEQALEASDRIEALENRISELEGTSVNLTEARSHLEAAETDFREQRFEEVGSDIDASYSSISDAQSAQTQIESFAAAQRQGIQSWIQDKIDYLTGNPIKVTVSGFILLLISWLSLHELRTFRLLKIRQRKEIKRDVLEDLIQEIQENYYMKKEGSPVRFKTKHEKFEKLRRDTIQDIDVLEEKLEGRWSFFADIEEELREESEEMSAEDVEFVDNEEDKVEDPDSIEHGENKEEVQEPEQEDQTDEKVSEESSEEDSEEDNPEESYECPDCGRSFDTERGMHIHQTQVHEDSGYTCEVCGDEFETERGLHIHEGMKHDDAEGVECPDCGRTFDTERGMHIHRGEIHKD